MPRNVQQGPVYTFNLDFRLAGEDLIHTERGDRHHGPSKHGIELFQRQFLRVRRKGECAAPVVPLDLGSVRDMVKVLMSEKECGYSHVPAFKPVAHALGCIEHKVCPVMAEEVTVSLGDSAGKISNAEHL